MATYDLTSTTPTEIKTGDIINCPYSGDYKTITLPEGIYTLEVWGGKGSANPGYSRGTLTLTSENTTLYLYSGGNSSGSSGGWNGGGKGSYATVGSTKYESYGGGGGSDIRINSTSLYARVIVAGGSGGSANSKAAEGGSGGGVSGAAGIGYAGGKVDTTYAGAGGTATSGGTAPTGGTAGNFGTGGNGTYILHFLTNSVSVSGGGGGGWYGGSSGGSAKSTTSSKIGGGGGGSGYVYTSSTASNYPSDCLLNSSFYLTDASTTSNVTTNPSTSGGYCRITVVKVKSCPFSIKIDSSTWKEIDSAWIKIDSSTWKEINGFFIKSNTSTWNSG